ncbi:MAG: recombinase family protein [Lachnospiraceae bacterium]|nr:recombinase family protein [Lachnospiraceae bacterium]
MDDSVRIAIYIRLSSADEETGKHKDESNSVINQRNLINCFLDDSDELRHYKRTEFVDDGYTGTNTDRPAFKSMISRIRDGKYNLCITKDFSRFSRNYIEMGDYLECVFPFLNVRYISINDGYDSQDYKGTTGGLDVVMRALVYDAYSKDLSVKVKTGMRQSRMKGNRTSGTPAYGYMPDPKKRGRDIIDPETAPVVRRIFDEALAGRKPSAIAKGLNEDGVKTPSQHFAELYPENRKYRNLSEKQAWTNGMIYPILHRLLYTGASVGGMTKKPSPCSKYNIKTSREEWIIVQDIHPAIITVEEYEKVQSMFDLEKVPERTPRSYPLRSLVYCGNCGRHMNRMTRVDKFYCLYGHHGGHEGCKGIISPRMSDMEKIVLNAIKGWIEQNEMEFKNSENQHFKKMQEKKKCRLGVREQEEQLRFLKRNKLLIYEQYSDGILSKTEYLQKKASIDEEIKEFEDPKERIRIATLEGEETFVSSEKDALCRAFGDEEKLTYEMAHAFVEKIIVYRDERLEIVWKYKDNTKGVADKNT